MPDVQLVGLQDPSPALVAKRAAAVGNPPIFTDYRHMLAETKPDSSWLSADLQRHEAEIAHYLLDHG